MTATTYCRTAHQPVVRCSCLRCTHKSAHKTTATAPKRASQSNHDTANIHSLRRARGPRGIAP